MSRWPSVPIRRLARLGSGHTPSRQHPEYWENCTISWLTLADVAQLRDGTRTVLTETAERISELGVANSAAEVHPADTVVLSRTASVGFSCILGTPMATSQDFATWTCGTRILPRFLLYSLRAQPHEIEARKTGSTHKTIYMPDIETLRTPLPPLSAQQAIVDFLDSEIVLIDELIAKRKQLSTLFLERRSAAVHHAVSGAFTNRASAESRLTWLGRVGADWDEVKLTHVARLGSGHTPSRDHPEWWVDCTVPWVTTGEVSQMRSDRIEFIHETREKISELGLANSAAELHPAGTVVLCRTAASAGFSAIMGAEMATSQDFATWTCGPRLRPRFLLLCLRAMRKDLLGRLATGSTHKTIYMPDIESLRIPLPPLAEQDAIVDEAWKRLTAIDTALDTLARQVALLHERRQALTTAAVTGELEIAGVAA